MYDNFGKGAVSFIVLEILFLYVFKLGGIVAFNLEAYEMENPQRNGWKIGVLFGIITVCLDSFFLLIFYPGVMEYDSYIQMCQVFGEPYSNHHPWLHTILIKGIYELGMILFQNTNKAFALYCFVQICMMAFTVAAVVSYLRNKGMKIKYVIFIGLLYLLSPINQMYSIIMWKDIPFAVVVTLYMLLICKMRDLSENGHVTNYNWGIFIILGFGVCFLRSNGLYVFIGMVPFLSIYFSKERKKIIFSILTVLLLGIIYKGPIFEYFQVSEPDVIESLSIPAQQIAAVVAEEGGIDEKQKEILENIIDLKKVPDAYNSSVTCSDAIKNLVREKDNEQYITENSGKLIKVYMQLFFQNPNIYWKAFVNETRGYWYHQTYFPFIWATYIQDNGMGIERDSKMPEKIEKGVRKYLDGYKNYFDTYESTGVYIYIFFICMFCAFHRKNKQWIVFLPPLGIWGTLLLATPVYADLRYVYAIYFSLPLLLGVALRKKIEE